MTKIQFSLRTTKDGVTKTMLTRSQSFPARMPIPRNREKVIIKENSDYDLVFKGESPETKRVNKQMCFLVDTCEGYEWWSIDEFLCHGAFTDEDVCDWINHKNEVVRLYPNVKRRCFMCNRFALKGKTICHDYHTHQGVKAKDYIT